MVLTNLARSERQVRIENLQIIANEALSADSSSTLSVAGHEVEWLGRAGRRIVVLEQAPEQVWLAPDVTERWGARSIGLLLNLARMGRVDRAALFEATWSTPYRPPSSDNALNVAIHRLRRELAAVGASVAARPGEYELEDAQIAYVRQGSRGRTEEDITGLLHLLKTQRRVQIIGRPGSGRMTLARRVGAMLEWANDTDRTFIGTEPPEHESPTILVRAHPVDDPSWPTFAMPLPKTTEVVRSLQAGSKFAAPLRFWSELAEATEYLHDAIKWARRQLLVHPPQQVIELLASKHSPLVTSIQGQWAGLSVPLRDALRCLSYLESPWSPSTAVKIDPSAPATLPDLALRGLVVQRTEGWCVPPSVRRWVRAESKPQQAAIVDHLFQVLLGGSAAPIPTNSFHLLDSLKLWVSLEERPEVRGALCVWAARALRATDEVSESSRYAVMALDLVSPADRVWADWVWMETQVVGGAAVPSDLNQRFPETFVWRAQFLQLWDLSRQGKGRETLDFAREILPDFPYSHRRHLIEAAWFDAVAVGDDVEDEFWSLELQKLLTPTEYVEARQRVMIDSQRSFANGDVPGALKSMPPEGPHSSRWPVVHLEWRSRFWCRLGQEETAIQVVETSSLASLAGSTLCSWERVLQRITEDLPPQRLASFGSEQEEEAFDVCLGLIIAGEYPAAIRVIETLPVSDHAWAIGSVTVLKWMLAVRTRDWGSALRFEKEFPQHRFLTGYQPLLRALVQDAWWARACDLGIDLSKAEASRGEIASQVEKFPYRLFAGYPNLRLLTAASNQRRTPTNEAF